MDNGIGRTGYRLLALVFLAVGLLGLVLAWVAAPVLVDTALTVAAATVAAALMALFALAMVLTAGGTAATPSAPGPMAPQRATPSSGPASAGAPGALEFEYGDGPARTEPLSGDDEFHAVLHRADTSDEPVRTAPPAGSTTDWPVRTPKHARPAPEEPTPEPRRNVARELADRYTTETPMVRAILSASHDGPSASHEPVREVTAKRVEPGVRPGDAPRGTKMGRCGGCNSVLLAPTERPLRLRCPRCRRVTLLKE